MDLIIGGAYQGKLHYAIETYHLAEGDLCFCQAGIDPQRRCICYPERALYESLRRGEAFHLPPLRPDAVVVCSDLSCGVVPVDKLERLWREEAGRLTCALAAQAESVTRIFCGLPLRLK